MTTEQIKAAIEAEASIRSKDFAINNYGNITTLMRGFSAGFERAGDWLLSQLPAMGWVKVKPAEGLYSQMLQAVESDPEGDNKSVAANATNIAHVYAAKEVAELKNYNVELSIKAISLMVEVDRLKGLIEEALIWGYHAAKDEAKGIASLGYGRRFKEKHNL